MIVGLVKDQTGGVLPGVVVEISSPALIGGVQSVVTDAGGQYRVVDLRPGTYVIACSLTGFRSVRVEGIVLRAAFTATVNVELSTSGIEESVTVSGASPVVDERVRALDRSNAARRSADLARDLRGCRARSWHDDEHSGCGRV